MKIISGGQTGADQGGLEAAKELGFETGGTMPNGFITQDGPKPEFAELYGIVEHTSPKYSPRTEENVKNSDATFRFAIDFTTAGEVCTLKYIKKHKKPYLDINMERMNEAPNIQSVKFVAKWLRENKVETLNIAGNSNIRNPLMQEKTKEFMVAVLSLYRGDEQ